MATSSFTFVALVCADQCQPIGPPPEKLTRARALPSRPNPTIAAQPAHIPTWDANLRVLSVDGLVVKQFSRAAENQQLILSVFQEEGWPARIDDPLSPVELVDSKRRLN